MDLKSLAEGAKDLAQMIMVAPRLFPMATMRVIKRVLLMFLNLLPKLYLFPSWERSSAHMPMGKLVWLQLLQAAKRRIFLQPLEKRKAQ